MEKVNIVKVEAELNSWYPSERPLYRLIKAIGHGSYGQVFLGTDLIVPPTEDQRVAVKRIFSDILQDATTAHKMLREICIMAHFSGHPNIVELRDVAPVHGDFQSLFIVMEHVEFDLKAVLKHCEMLTGEHVEYYLYQLLCALNCVHEAGIIHRDIHPGNILVNPVTNVLKLTDFGLSRPVDPKEMTTDVAMLWYRAPELCMESTQYDGCVDIWSVGCILAELFSPLPLPRKPLFPGPPELPEQLEMILKVVGAPDPADVSRIGSLPAQKFVIKKFCQKPGFEGIDLRTTLRFPEGTPLSSDAFDLLQRLLAFCPWKRICAAEALIHPYLRTAREFCHANEEWKAGQFTYPFKENKKPDLMEVKKEIADNIPKIRAKLGFPPTPTQLPPCQRQPPPPSERPVASPPSNPLTASGPADISSSGAVAVGAGDQADEASMVVGTLSSNSTPVSSESRSRWTYVSPVPKLDLRVELGSHYEQVFAELVKNSLQLVPDWESPKDNTSPQP